MFLFLSPSTFFGLPLFLFLFLCLSLALVLFFLSSLSFFFLLSFGSFFLSLSNCSFFFAFVFWKEQHAIFKLQFIVSSIFSLFYGFLSCFSLSNPFFLSLLVSWYSVMFLLNINVFGFKKTQVKKHQVFGQKGSCNKTVFLITCVLKNVKSYRFFWPLFWPNFGWCSKNTVKIGVSAHFQKQKKEKMTIFQSYYLGQVNVIIWAKFVAT